MKPMPRPKKDPAALSLDRSLTLQQFHSDWQAMAAERIRSHAKTLGRSILETPETAERTIAIRRLEESVMWAIKNIALAPGPDDDSDSL